MPNDGPLTESPGVIAEKDVDAIHNRVRNLNHSSKHKLLLYLMWLSCFLSAILVPLLFAIYTEIGESYIKRILNISTSDDKVDAHAATNAAGFLLCWSPYILPLPFYLIYYLYVRCFSKQVFECFMSEGKHFPYVYSFGMWLIVLFGYLYEPSKTFAFCNYSGFVIFLWSIAIVVFQYKYCKCKCCQNQKDVKIWHHDKCIEVFETKQVTSEFLHTELAIRNSFEKLLALQLENGEIIHKFKYPDSSVRLYPGRYEVIQMTVNGVTIRHLGATKSITYNKEFNDVALRNWFHLDNDSLIAIQNAESGQIVHTFHDKREEITLEDGNYVLDIFMLISNTLPQPTSCPFISKAKEETTSDCTILDVD